MWREKKKRRNRTSVLWRKTISETNWNIREVLREIKHTGSRNRQCVLKWGTRKINTHWIMNSNTAAIQTGHHHHHHQTTSSSSANQQYHHPSTVTTQQAQQIKPAVNPNPSVHRFNSLNENPWLLQSQVPQQGPTPPLRQHKRPAPTPPAVAPALSSQSQLAQKPTTQHLSVNSTYNQPVHFTVAAQTQTTPGLATANVLQHSPKSPNQNFLQQPAVGSLMSTSLNSASAANMVNSHHHLPPPQTQPLSTSLHHSTSSSLSNNNNNNNNFDDLNKNGLSSISGASTSQGKKVEMKLNTMPWVDAWLIWNWF